LCLLTPSLLSNASSEKRTSENNLGFSRILDLELNYKNVNGVGNSPLLIAGLDGYNMGGTLSLEHTISC